MIYHGDTNPGHEKYHCNFYQPSLQYSFPYIKILTLKSFKRIDLEKLHLDFV